jgi:hypothetical protein
MTPKLHPSIAALGLGLCTFLSNQTRAQFVPDDIQVGSTNVDYIDPEFLSEHSRMVFQDAQAAGNLYVALIDPLTGALVSADGKDLLLDTGIAALGNSGLTANGPEWGLDSSGPAVFYEKTGSNGLVQVWRAQGILSGPVQVQQFTTSDVGATSKVVRKEATQPTTAFICKLASTASAAGQVHFIDEASPTFTTQVQGFIASSYLPAWVPGTPDFIYARASGQTTLDLARFNGTTLSSVFLTFGEPGVKKNPVAFHAPELGGELVIGFVKDATALVLFRLVGTTWTQWTALAPPDPVRPYLYSPEVFEAGGVTYIAVSMKDVDLAEGGTDASMWIMSVGATPGQHLYRRVDEGAVSGLAARRFEPEPLVGSEEVFLFYNVVNAGRTQLRRARTGIFKQPTPTLALDPIGPGALQLRTGLTQPGFSYQIETSTTLTNWMNFAAPFAGNGSVFTTNISTSGGTHRFYRVRQIQENP